MGDDLRVGDRVYNPRYGRGTVLRSERIDTYRKVVIRFESGEEFTLRDPNSLHLERLEAAPAAAPPEAPAPQAAVPPPAAIGQGAAAGPREDEVDRETLRQLLVEVLEEVSGPAQAPLAERWRGGTLVLKPGKADTLAKEIPIEKLFQKIVRLRDQLRVLEQKINSHPAIQLDEKIALQHYITRCYGSLTTFNLLFKDADDRFAGSGGGDESA